MPGWTCLLVILAAAVVRAASDQQVFQQHAAPGLKPAFDKTNSTGNFIFWSVNSFLQYWPNSRYINGHTITAATIAPGTILYHGRPNNDGPMKMDWLATDPEHSYAFCGKKCYLYTYVATRSLRLAYFDGFSGAKAASSGALDTQDIMVWGKVRPDMTSDELARIQELCRWGDQFKLDGFVRMEVGFEIMACDFDVGMELVSESELVPHADNDVPLFLLPPTPSQPPPRESGPEVPPGWRGSVVSAASSIFEVINAATWHKRSPAETRIKIDYSRVVSFFDPALSSLVNARAGKLKENFRLDELSEADSKYVKDQLTDIFTRDGQGSGADWGSIVQVIVDRYGGRLELLRHILQNPELKRNVTERAAEARSQVLIMLSPYMLTSAIPPNPIGPVDPSWVDPVVKHCASTHTSWASEALLTPQEKVIKGAVEEVLSQICGVLGDIWVDAFDSEQAGVKELERLLWKWQSDISGLMDWLDWPVWLKCDPGCGREEICYIATWSWGAHFDGNVEATFIDKTPRCVDAVAPYSFLQIAP